MNQLTFDKPYLAEIEPKTKNDEGKNIRYSSIDLLMGAYFASEVGAEDPIEKAVRVAAEKEVPQLVNRKDPSKFAIDGYQVINFVPFNPHAK